MADYLWVGTDTGNEGVWAEADNWSPAAIPGASDTAFLVTGNQDVTGAVGLTGITRIVVGPQYTGSIGSSTTALDIDATDLDYAGEGGGAYFKGTYTTVTVQETGTGTAALTFDDSTITTLRIQGGKGTITVDTGSAITSVIDQIGADNVTLVIEADSAMVGCTLTMDSGIVEMSEAIPNITVYGGELRTLISDASDVTTVTLLEQYGGKVRWRPTASCTLDELILYTGLFDSRDSTAPTFTITDTTVHQNGLIDERSGLQNAIYSTALAMEGGEVRYDAGRAITIA